MVDLDRMDQAALEYQSLQKTGHHVQLGPAFYKATEVINSLNLRLSLYSPELQNGLISPLIEKLTSLNPQNLIYSPEPDEKNMDMLWALIECIEQNCPETPKTNQELKKAVCAMQAVLVCSQTVLNQANATAKTHSSVLPALPPAVKFHTGSTELYVLPLETTTKIHKKIQLSVFSLRTTFLNESSLPAWTALPLWPVGDCLLLSNDDLHNELEDLLDQKLDPFMADYWKPRLGRGLSDVLCVLNLGPAAVVGLTTYFKATHPFSLETNSSTEYRLRILLAYGVLGLEEYITSFPEVQLWSKKLFTKVKGDPTNITLTNQNGTKDFTFKEAQQSMNQLAEILATMKLKSLNNKSLADLKIWNNEDAKTSEFFAKELARNRSPYPPHAREYNSFHVLSGATIAYRPCCINSKNSLH